MAVGPEKVLNPVDGHEGSDCQLAAADGPLCGLGLILRQASSSALSLLLFLIFIPLFRDCSCLLAVLGLCVAWAALRVRAVAFSPPRLLSLWSTGAWARGRQRRSTWPRFVGSAAAVLGLTCSSPCAIFLLQGLNGVPALQGGCLTPGPLGSPC